MTRRMDAPGANRISNLPCNILEHIFMYLSLRDVVRTSILSRDWRYKWVTNSYLDFNRQLNEQFPGNRSPESIINQALLWHKGPIVKFSILDANVESPYSIDSWLLFLLNQPIEYLGIELPGSYLEQITYLMPKHLYKFVHLRTLYLQNAKIVLPPGFQGFSSLLNLNLFRVMIEHEELITFISQCPMLESLDIYNHEDAKVGKLDISAPNLKSFRFCGLFSSLCFSSPNIIDISVTYEVNSINPFELGDLPWSESKMVEVFSQLPFIKKAHIGSGFLEYLALGGMVQTLPNNLDFLTNLKLEGINFRSIDNVVAILCLIRSSPNLQHLQLEVEVGEGDEDDDDEDTLEYMKEQRAQNFHFQHLKIVKFFEMSDLEVEMEFLKLVLIWATTLEHLKVKFHVDDDEKEEEDEISRLSKDHKIKNELKCFPRTSSTAVITFE